jgi:hypothetical protein
MKSDRSPIILWDELNTFRGLNYIFIFSRACKHFGNCPAKTIARWPLRKQEDFWPKSVIRE